MNLHITFFERAGTIERAAARLDKERIARAAATSAFVSTDSADIDALLAVIGRGRVVAPFALKSASRGTGNSNFKSANVVFVDVDNTRSDIPMLTKEAATQLPYVAAAFSSPNDSPERHRFRLVYILPYPVSTIAEYQGAQTGIASLLSEYTGQFEFITRPTWGCNGCWRWKSPIPTLVPATLLGAWLGEAHVKRMEREARARQASSGTEWNLDEVRRLLSFLPTEMAEYRDWQAVVFGISSVLSESDTIQAIAEWSPGRDRKYIELIRRDKLRQSSSRVKIGTAIKFAQEYSGGQYKPPTAIPQPNESKGGSPPPKPAWVHYNEIFETPGRRIAPIVDEVRRVVRDHDRVLLVAPPGAGKTELIKTFAELGRVLVISPNRVLVEQQGERFAVVHGASISPNDDPEEKRAAIAAAPVVVVTFDGVRDYYDQITAQRWSYIIVDESHILIGQPSFRLDAKRYVDRLLNSTDAKIVWQTATNSSDAAKVAGYYAIRVIPKEHQPTEFLVESYEKALPAIISRLDRCITADTVTVVRVNSKKTLDALKADVVRRGTLPPDSIAVITADTVKGEAGTAGALAYKSIVENAAIPSGVRLLLTTSILDTGLNIENMNVGEIIVVDPETPDAVVQFAARFRNLELVRVSVLHKEQAATVTQKFTAETFYSGLTDRIEGVVAFLNFWASHGENADGIVPKLGSVIGRDIALGIEKVEGVYTVNRLYVTARAHEEGTRRLCRNRDEFYNFIAAQHGHVSVRFVDAQEVAQDAADRVLRAKVEAEEKMEKMEKMLLASVEADPARFARIFCERTRVRRTKSAIIRAAFGGIKPAPVLSDDVHVAEIEAVAETPGIFSSATAEKIIGRVTFLVQTGFELPDTGRLVVAHWESAAWGKLLRNLHHAVGLYVYDAHREAISPKDFLFVSVQAAIRQSLTGKLMPAADALDAVNAAIPQDRHYALFKPETQAQAGKVVAAIFGEAQRTYIDGKRVRAYNCSKPQTLDGLLNSLAVDTEKFKQTIADRAGETANGTQLPYKREDNTIPNRVPFECEEAF